MSQTSMATVRARWSARTLLHIFAGVVFFAVLAAWPAPSQAATCPCSPPADQTCPTVCSSCTSQPVSCTCDTGCGASGCPAGYSQISSSSCFPLSPTYTCSTSRLQKTSTCAGCAPGRWGPDCTACPGGAGNPCNGHGTCSEGIAGNGTCTCAAGYNGVACQYSNEVTCNGHGTVSANGSCLCNVGYTGPACNACAPDYYAYPACTFCKDSITCSGHGTCSTAGICVCGSEYAGPNCGSCATDRYGYPTCRFCQSQTTCAGHGTCDASGFCACDPAYGGPGCGTCAVDHYGYPACVFCNAQTTCSGHGVCDAATGACVCDAGYTGQSCLQCSVGAVELSCSDGIDEDCDMKTDCLDTDCCTAASCSGLDGDGDLYVSCDCDDTNGQIWATPGEVHDLTVKPAGGTSAKLTWFPPDVPGGSAPIYDTLRFDDPRDFDLATTCLATQNPTLNSITDAAVPTEGKAFFYLVRARNACPSGVGPLGTDSSGNPRTGTCGH